MLQLLGNDDVKELLQRLVKTSRVPNALLFVGAEGIGKKQFAVELARAFLCRNPADGLACHKCSACLRVGKFALPNADERDDHKRVIFSEHPDLGLVIPYKRNILVDAIRELEREAYFRPYEAAARFFIIDDADKMNDEAANALLKTLEEPAATSHIVLVSSRPDALLQTIHSRCQMIRFAPIESQQIERFLVDVNQCSDADAHFAAQLCGGSVGFAVSMDVASLRARRDDIARILTDLLINKDRSELLRSGERLNDAKHQGYFEENIEMFSTLVHDVWLVKLGKADIVNTDILPHIEAMAKRCTTKNLAEIIQNIDELRENLGVNINKKVALDALLMKAVG